MFKVIIAGSRTFNNYTILKQTCDKLLVAKHPNIIIVSGCAKGADILGEQYAKEKGYAVEQYPANWDLCGKAAGYIRNEQMAKVAHGCIIFWDGVSRGSKHMADLAAKHGLLLRVIKYQ